MIKKIATILLLIAAGALGIYLGLTGILDTTGALVLILVAMVAGIIVERVNTLRS